VSETGDAMRASGPGHHGRGHGSPWRRAVLEGAAVIVSILLAFAIDAWWDGLQMRQEERQALRDLATEFHDNLGGIDRVIRHHDRSIESGVRLLRAASGSEPIPERPLLDSLLFAAFIDFTTFEPVSAALDDLLSSGRLGLIRDDSLRSALASWPREVEDAVEEQYLVRRMMESTLLPYLTPRIATADLYNNAHAGYGTFEPPREPSRLESLFLEREFESLLANRIAHERQALGEIGDLRSTVESILRRLPTIP